MNKVYVLIALCGCSGSNITISQFNDAGTDSPAVDSWTPTLTPTPPTVALAQEAGLPACGDSCDDSCRCLWTTTCQSQCGTTTKVCAQSNTFNSDGCTGAYTCQSGCWIGMLCVLPGTLNDAGCVPIPESNPTCQECLGHKQCMFFGNVCHN